VAEVYAICFPNGKLYVGWTAKTAIRRFAGHLRAVRQGSTYAVHNALRKYGPDETRAKMVATGRRLWQDPEYRAKILEARRAARSAKGN